MELTGRVDAEAAQAAGMDAGKLQALADILHDRYVAPGKLPHMHLLVSRDEQPIMSVHSGIARATGEPLAEDALYRIASMTKPVTSVAFMMLVEQGLVALDDPVTKILPEFADLAVGADGSGRMRRPMLMIDLLRHTSGLTYGLQRQTAIDARYRDLGLDEFQQKRGSDEFIAALAALPLEFSPGERWNYSVSTDVLGVVVERLGGLDLERCFQERIFDPLGMPDTFFELPEDRVERMTDAWQWGPDGTLSLYDRGARSGWRRPLRLRSGGGGLISSVADYHRFARMLLRGGELDGARLLKPETVAAMHANHLPGGADLSSLSSSMFSEADYAGVGFGLGFATDLRTREYYWGGVFSTFFFIDPAERLIGIFMTQHFPSSIHPVRRELRQGIRNAIIESRAD
ncbi:serine hydrolase [Sphingobium indicum]|uniref:Serine hydrolase n=2 Tax=Sphingobium indicum TaxID=332055 RepID=A0A1L5BLQ5_SPHIB|nr:serine hydrolase domain-containing protein [Sphingobium indicum]APL93809.1 serine hydrolase [Sphingobium indicum B90A]KEY97244.1 beta-lactamase [Sphingomonas sp. BHC-A]NYI21635.1 CubicO group peptidase (beta-lactamase class C family) [Sphingobium indicum]RYM03586.1 serine hydrolase [Sphingobium indicum]